MRYKDVPDQAFEISSLKVKTTTQRYDLVFKEQGWATFFIDEDGGIITAITDWGNYKNFWASHGRKSFKHFLVEINGYYILEKFCGNPEHFDCDQTQDRIKEAIIKNRRDEELTQEDARICWDEVHDWGDGNLQSSVLCFPDQCPTTYEKLFYNELYAIPTVTTYTGWQQIFSRRIFPALQNVLRDEIAQQETT